MTYRGQVKNGQILLNPPAHLPEGAEVNVELLPEGLGTNGSPAAMIQQRMKRRIRLDPELARRIASLPEFHPDEL